MTAPVRLYPAVRTTVVEAGVPIVSMYGPLEAGARITNPYYPADQGLAVAEPLYVSIVGDATLEADGTTFAIQPGQYFKVPAGTTTNVSVNAASAGHRFVAYGSSIFVPYTPPTGGFPPIGPVTVTKTIPSYLYKEYDDDEDLQGFVDQYNVMAQDYVGWNAAVDLPVYTGPMIVGDLLDWVGAGLYGYPRPVLPSGMNRAIGPLNTWAPNVLGPNMYIRASNPNVYATTDDVYKRCLTWHLFKGDGKTFTVRWLKRRILRFLIGVDGTAPDVADTSRISVTFGIGNQVNINVRSGQRTITGGAFPNRFAPGTTRPNQLKSTFTPYSPFPLAPILKAGIDAGVLELPFQFTYVVNVL